MRAHRRTAGLTLVEIVMVCAMAAVFVVFLAGTIVTSTTMNRDTYVENEVVDLANRTADEVAAALSGAGRFTDCWDLSSVGTAAPYVGVVMGDQLEFQEVRFNDTTGLKEFGVYLPGQTAGVQNFGLNGVKRVVFVFERNFNETNFNAPAGMDINGDGDRLDTVVPVGRLELRTFLPGATVFVEQTGLRRTFGGGATRFCQRPGALATDAALAAGNPIFGRTPHTSWTAGSPPTLVIWSSRAGQIVRTEDDTNTTAAFPSAGHDPVDIDNIPATLLQETAFGSGAVGRPAGSGSPATSFYPAPATGDTMGSKVQAGTTAYAPLPSANNWTDPNPPITTQADTAVRLNLRVVFNPTPDARGRAEIHALNVDRTVTLQ